MASVSLGIWSAVGSRCERAGETGISHFLEHILIKGTPRRSAALPEVFFFFFLVCD